MFNLSSYIISVIIVLAIVNIIVWFEGGEAIRKKVEFVSLGFLLGMSAMYIAMHVYGLN